VIFIKLYPPIIRNKNFELGDATNSKTAKANMLQRTITMYPPLMETAPEAIGRLFFLGCIRSASTSHISLRQYIELDIKQKDIKTRIVGIR
jgi:hypothetical protein